MRDDVDPFDQTGALADYKRQTRSTKKADELADLAYEAGRQDATTSVDYVEPTEPAKAPKPAPVRTKTVSVGAGMFSATRSTTKQAGTAANEGAGILLGAIAYALFLAYLREGPSGPKRWIRAKFLNDTGSTTK